jgi:hypothetical protein
MGSGPNWGRRHSAWRWKIEQAEKAQKIADELCCEAWNERLHQLGGPLQPSPSIRAAISGGYAWLRVECSACQQNAWIDLRKVRRPPETWIWQLEGSLACSVCRERVRFPPRTKIECLCQHDMQFGVGRHEERD